MTPDPAPVAEATAPPAAPRYRYSTVPPAIVRLPVDDITALLPAGAWTGTEADRLREFALAASEILEGNFPRIRFDRLRDLLPGCIQPVPDAPEWIVLPTDRVALAYHPVIRRELIPDAIAPASPADATSTAAAKDRPIPAWKRFLKPVLAPPPSLPPPAADEARPETADPGSASSPAPGEPSEATATATPSPEPDAAPVSTLPLTAQRLSPEDEARLRQVFMTDDDLSVPRLAELAGSLPGLQGCVVARGPESVTAGATPATHDEAALIAGGHRLLDQLEAAVASPALPFKPALTLYAESGPISFLRHGNIGLLAIHRERGFLPGVREKLETLIETLDHAQRRIP